MDLTATQIAALCNVSERTVQRWLREKRLNAQALPNGRYRVSEDDLAVVMPPDTSTLVERIEATENALRGLYNALQSLIGRVEALEHKQERQAPQTRILKPAPAEYSVSPGDTVTARNFAEAHGLSRTRMETWIKHQAFETTIVEYQGKPQHRLTPEQQRGVIAYWQENHVPFQPCAVESCPCHEQA